MKDYYMAAYYFKRFTKNFPNSSRAEECAFSAAICNLESSPEYYLDQSDTYDAIDEFQLFINRYPSSNLIDSSKLFLLISALTFLISSLKSLANRLLGILRPIKKISITSQLMLIL